MNDNEPILVELRKLSAWADSQRKITKWSLIVIAVTLPLAVIILILIDRLQSGSDEIPLARGAVTHSWGEVDSNVRSANPDEAIRIGDELIKKMPEYPEGHKRLADAYLAAGKPVQAGEHYEQAFRLFPTEEYRRALAAIERRIREAKQTPAGTTNASPLTRP